MATMREVRRNAFMLVATALTVAAIACNILLQQGPEHPVRLLALPLGVCAALLIFLPFVTLKKHGAAEPGSSYMHTSAVVDRGLFGVVRHPQYLGYMCLNATFALTSMHWITVALGVAAVVFFYLHAMSEERFMLEKLGADYEQYMHRVPRFNVVAGMVRAIATKK
jgi:protein-S-isoprenylcysteine O-methyltransferase Ste14